jgi:hypothetical protein
MRPAELLPTSAPLRSTKRTSKGRFIKRRDAGIKISVVTTRRQTPKEARTFTAALDLLLAELIRHEIKRVRRKL